VCFAEGEDTRILEAFVAVTFQFMVDKYIVSAGTWLAWGGRNWEHLGEGNLEHLQVGRRF
jgi:hypothetical protein